MKYGKIEPKKDAETLMGIYNKFDGPGHMKEPLTMHEQVLIYCLAKYLKEIGRQG